MVDTPTTRRILILASNPAVSDQTGWPIGFWWAEPTHPYWEFTERGYEVDIASPQGGLLDSRPVERPRGRLRLLRIRPHHARFPGVSERQGPGR